MKKRSVKIAGHATSISLEDEFWEILKSLAAGRHISLAALIEDVDKTRTGNLSSALRVYVLKSLRQ